MRPWNKNGAGKLTGMAPQMADRRGLKVMRVQSGHWLEYDPVALVVLVLGIGALTLLALSI
jgi:hypothetical protein